MIPVEESPRGIVHPHVGTAGGQSVPSVTGSVKEQAPKLWGVLNFRPWNVWTPNSQFLATCLTKSTLLATEIFILALFRVFAGDTNCCALNSMHTSTPALEQRPLYSTLALGVSARSHFSVVVLAPAHHNKRAIHSAASTVWISISLYLSCKRSKKYDIRNASSYSEFRGPWCRKSRLTSTSGCGERRLELEPPGHRLCGGDMSSVPAEADLLLVAKDLGLRVLPVMHAPRMLDHCYHESKGPRCCGRRGRETTIFTKKLVRHTPSKEGRLF